MRCAAIGMYRSGEPADICPRSLVLGDQLRVERPGPIPRHRQRHLRGAGQDGLLRIAIAVVRLALGAVAVQVFVELGIQNPFRQRLLQFVDQPIFVEYILRIAAGRKAGPAGLSRLPYDAPLPSISMASHTKFLTVPSRFGRPEIFNKDQGSQFTSFAFTNTLKDADIRISMDGRGRWMDNVFIERLWRSLKYECVYLNAFETGSQARTGIARWVGAPMGRSAKRRRLCCSITLAQPARHREQAGKIYPPAIQCSASLQAFLSFVVQRRTPAWGNRPKGADYVAQSRWRSQHAVVIKAENLTAGGPKFGSRADGSRRP